MPLTSPPAHAAPSTEALAGIREALRGDISMILQRNMPVLTFVAQDRVYDTIMDDPHLLHQAFTLFRARPELFQGVVATPSRALPQRDDEPLICGRTLGEGVSLVVRACARRYFRHRLGGPRAKSSPVLRLGWWQGVKISLGLEAPPQRPRPRKPAPTRAERLYQAMRDVLLYEWQVPLIPTYASLEPHTVSLLGPRLLDYRDPLKLQALADTGADTALLEGRSPLLLDSAQRLLTPSSDSINAEVLWNVGQKMRIAALFPNYDTSEMRKAVALIAATTPVALEHLMAVLGHDIRQFTLLLFTAYGTLGPIRYRQTFAQQGHTWVVQALAKRIAQEPPLVGTHEEMKQAMTRWLDTALEALTDGSPKPRD